MRITVGSERRNMPLWRLHGEPFAHKGQWIRVPAYLLTPSGTSYPVELCVLEADPPPVNPRAPWR